MPVLRYASVWTSLLVCLLAPFIAMQSPLIAGGKTQSVPSKAAVKKAKALVKELYQKEYALAAKDTAEKSRLAAIFLQEGRDTNDYPAGRYVLFQEARDLAAEAGDVNTTLQAIEELALSFPLKKADVFEMKVQTLTRASRATLRPDAYRNVVDAALILLEDALTNDDYDAALRLVKTAEAAGIKLRSVPLVSSIRRRGKEVVRLKKDYDKIRPFVEKLRSNPNDPRANLEVGKYHAFLKDHWSRGLPYLMRANDPRINRLARLEQSGQKTIVAQIILGEGWREVAKNVKGEERYHVLLRAYQWLQKAERELRGGKRQQVAQTMQKIMDALPPGYRIGEIAREIRTFTGHDGPVFDVDFSPDGRKLASGGADGSVIVWDVKTGKIIRRMRGHEGPVWTVAFAPDGRHVLSGGFDKSIRLWDLTSGKDIRRYEGHKDYVRGVVFSQDGQRILSCSDDRTVRLWDVPSGKEIAQFLGHKHYVWDVALSRDGKFAASASLDRSICVWEIPDENKSSEPVTLQPLRRFTAHNDTVLAVAISPDGRKILSGSTDKTVRLWDTATGKELLVLKGSPGYVTTVAFSPDGRRALSAGYDKMLHLWDLQAGEEVRNLEGHGGRIWSVVFSHDGRHAATASHDGTVRLWGGKK